MRSRILRWLFGIFLCGVFSLTAQAMTGMIYQPQQRDMKLPDAFWPPALSDLRKRGFDTLIVQWTQHGKVFSKGAEKKWLHDRLRDAVAADLKLVIGLYADPDSFSALESPTDLLEAYFLKNTEKNIGLVKGWISTLPEKSIVGWYLPMEIDDRRWRARDDELFLAEQLSRDVRALKNLTHVPVYITSFFKGHSDVNGYKAMLNEIKKVSDVRLWIQDGVGTRTLMPAETALYLKPLSVCQDTPIDGLVFEIFRQIGPDSDFKADPLAANIKENALLQRAPCDGNSVFFSLRYLTNFGN